MVSQQEAPAKTVRNALVPFPSIPTISVRVVSLMNRLILTVDMYARNVPKATPEIIAKGKEKKLFICRFFIKLRNIVFEISFN